MSQRSDDDQASAGPSCPGRLLLGYVRGWMCPNLRCKGSSAQHACSSMVVSQYTRVPFACSLHTAPCHRRRRSGFRPRMRSQKQNRVQIRIILLDGRPGKNESSSRRFGFSPYIHTRVSQTKKQKKEVLLTIVVREKKKKKTSRPRGHITRTRQLKNWKAEALLSLSVSWKTARQNSRGASSSFVDAIPTLVEDHGHFGGGGKQIRGVKRGEQTAQNKEIIIVGNTTYQ